MGNSTRGGWRGSRREGLRAGAHPAMGRGPWSLFRRRCAISGIRLCQARGRHHRQIWARNPTISPRERLMSDDPLGERLERFREVATALIDRVFGSMPTRRYRNRTVLSHLLTYLQRLEA